MRQLLAWTSSSTFTRPASIAPPRREVGDRTGDGDTPAGVTVWGGAPYASYGYAGGTGLRPIHDVRRRPWPTP